MSIKRLKDESGSAAAEFAIIAPVFLFMIAGMIAYGIYFGAAHSVQQAAAEAARASVAGLDDEERQELAFMAIEASVTGHGFLQPENIRVAVNTDPDQADLYLVTVTYDASHLPIWEFGLPLPLPEPTIRRTSAIRVGGS